MSGAARIDALRLRFLLPLTLLLGLLGLLAAPVARANIYWSSNASFLLRAGNDGEGLGPLVETPPSSDAVAIDDNYVYWTSSDGRIGRAKLDGSDANPNFITGLPSYLPGLAVGVAYIYWSSLTAVGRANLDGTGVKPNFIATNHASGLAIDSQHIYWGENTIGKVARASLDGSGVEEEFIPAPGDPCSVAVDSSHVYWADATGNAIGRANLNGSGVQPRFLDPGAAVDCGVAVSDSYVYFGINGYPGPSSIARANLDGSGLTNQLFSLGLYGGPFVQMAVDSLTPPPGPEPVSNSFKIVGVLRNKHKGTARIKLSVPGAGIAVLFGQRVRKAVRKVSAAGVVFLPVHPKRGLATTLKRRHRGLVRLKLRYTPTGGTPATRQTRIRLVRTS